jgi:hypothetical protein
MSVGAHKVPQVFCFCGCFICGYGTSKAGNVGFFPVSQPACIVTLHHLGKDEGACNSDGANEAVG